LISAARAVTYQASCPIVVSKQSSKPWLLRLAIVALTVMGLAALTGLTWLLAPSPHPIAGTYVSNLGAAPCRLVVKTDGSYTLYFKEKISATGRWALLPEPLYKVRDYRNIERYRPLLLPAHPSIRGHYIDTYWSPNHDLRQDLDSGFIELSTLRRYDAPGTRPHAFFFDPKNPNNLTVTNGEQIPLVTILFYTRQDTWPSRLRKYVETTLGIRHKSP